MTVVAVFCSTHDNFVNRWVLSLIKLQQFIFFFILNFETIFLYYYVSLDKKVPV